MIQFDPETFLGILYFVLIYIAITAVYAIAVTDYFMKIWESKRISGAHRVLLVTAHPDDECMFFGPAIIALSKKVDTSVYVVCLSPGDFEGLGSKRKLELWQSCRKLGVHEGNITCFNHHHLKDDPDVLWKTSHMSKILLQYVNGLDIDTLITFDEYGVSGHLNHVSIYHCVSELIERRQLPQKCRVFSLESVSWFRKYILGIFDVYLSYLSSSFMYVTNKRGRGLIRSAMEAHTTQYVWYRKLYMVFSRYVNVNTFKEVRHSSLQRNSSESSSKRRKFPLFRSPQQKQQQQQQQQLKSE